jgi:hypothetical protein
MLGKIKKIRADLPENRLNSGNFITILHKNSGKLSTAPLESISPVRLWEFCPYMKRNWKDGKKDERRQVRKYVDRQKK